MDCIVIQAKTCCEKDLHDSFAIIYDVLDIL